MATKSQNGPMTAEATQVDFEVLSPRADVDPIVNIGLQPRLDTLDGKTIGLFTTFKGHWVLILDEIGKQLKAIHPNLKLTSFRYGKDLNAYTQVAEVAKDSEVRPEFEKWLSGVDAVICANADAGSCTLYLTFNATLAELLGKPLVLTVDTKYVDLAQRSAELRGVPNLRLVELNLSDLSCEPSIEDYVNKVIPAAVAGVLDKIEGALVSPLSSEEASPRKPSKALPRIVHQGSLSEINTFFYKCGWAYGMPIMPPTEEAVAEMLTGTDLPADHVVAKVPPMLGKATVEKIAINAVMAGCLPTHLPVLIAAVEAMVDPRMWIEAYTCSVASWAPLLIVNGPIRNEIAVNCKGGFMSPYYRANAAIAHAFGLIVMNIAGISDGIEDKAIFGNEGRFGMCIGENEEDNPWESLHRSQGMAKEDNAVTLFWPNERKLAMVATAGHVTDIVTAICDTMEPGGFDPGCAVILCPETARILHDGGFSRKDLIDYILEYARRPAAKMNLRWMSANKHAPKGMPLPLEPTRTVRKLFSALHLPVIVAGRKLDCGVVMYTGGGDHGGPITKKIATPRNWNVLVAKYAEFR